MCVLIRTLTNFSQQIYVNIQVILFTVFAFLQQILKLWLKRRTFSKSTFRGLFEFGYTLCRFCLRLGVKYWELWGFLHLIKATFENLSKTRKLPYIPQLVENQNNKDTFFSWTYKVQGSKVPLVFWLSTIWLIYCFVLISI